MNVARNSNGEPTKRPDCDLCGQVLPPMHDSGQEMPGDFFVHHACCDRICDMLRTVFGERAEICADPQWDRFVTAMIRAAQKARAEG